MPIEAEINGAQVQTTKDGIRLRKKRKRDSIEEQEAETGRPKRLDHSEKRSHVKEKEVKRRKTPDENEGDPVKHTVTENEKDNIPADSVEREKKQKKKKKDKVTQNEAIEKDLKKDEPLAKHPTIFRKFRKTLKQKANIEAADVPSAKPVEPQRHTSPNPQGLQPLPQPALTKSSTKIFLPLSSSLPTYHSATITVSPSHSIPFSMLSLSPMLQTRLTQHLKYHSAFAVQATVIPLLLEPPNRRCDLLISAPTGSGKTFSYILPITSDLCYRVVTRLRALIIVPTRELVSQVRDTAESLASGLKIGTAWGARGLDVERKLLIEEDLDGQDQWHSKIDILICTPGRLVEHITSTAGFTLKHLKWLVVDEADRLLAQSFQEWAGILMKALESIDGCFESVRTYSETKRIDLRGLGLRSHRGNSECSVTKIALSATMTKDAGKLSGLKLRKPKLVIIGDRLANDPVFRTVDVDTNDSTLQPGGDDDPNEIFSVPHTLSEYYIFLPTPSDKPLTLESLIRLYDLQKGTLIFTKSNESAARLHRLLQLMAKLDNNRSIHIGLITGEIAKAERKKMLSLFKRNEVDMLVASDLIARGLDVPDIKHIINYDVPSTSRAYVHRVGRTARAGNAGDAWNLVSGSEAGWFWRNIGKGIKRKEGGIKKISLGVDETQRERYENSLVRLREEVKGPSGGKAGL